MNSTQIPDKEYLNPYEVQEHLRNAFGIYKSIQTIYRWCDEGKLENLKIMGSVVIPKKSYIEFVIEAYRIHKISS